MADEELAIAPAEQAPPAIEPEVTPDEPERIPGPEEAATGDDVQAVEPEEELDDWQHQDGKSYKVPKALTKHLMLDRDYTQGKQQLAEMKRAHEAERLQSREASEAELDDRASLRTITKDLEAYASYTQEDWTAFEQQDPLGAQQHWRNFQMLEKQKAEVQGRLETIGKERDQKAQQDLAKRVGDTLAEAPKIIPGFKPEQIGSLVELAASEFEMTEAELKQFWSPKLLKLLHRADLGTQLIKKQAQKPAPATVAPLATVNGKTSPAARGDLGSMDMEAYVAARKKGVGGKALS